MNIQKIVLGICLCFVTPGYAQLGVIAQSKRIQVVPQPVAQVDRPGTFMLIPATPWQVENDEQAEVVKRFGQQLQEEGSGWKLEVIRFESAGKLPASKTTMALPAAASAALVSGTRPVAIQPSSQQVISLNHCDSPAHSLQVISLNHCDSLADEGYRLRITPDSLQIQASGKAGFYYALQTVRQLLPPDLRKDTNSQTQGWELPCVEITDHPRFGYRGLMLDVSRYFIPKATLLRTIDCMALLKLNKLHLHLVDDNGWRLEIKRYPRLTQVGAWRVKRDEPFPSRKNPLPGEQTTQGGFYTQQEMKEIIDYAESRQIEIIPEIEMPAHTNSSLAAYPELACPVVKSFIGVIPGLGGKNAEIIYCAGNDSVFSFIENVLDEVMALFPSRYVHLGGDEAAKTHWKNCPLCQHRIQTENLANEEELQGYFMERVSRYVRSKGKTVMGWDELTNSKLPEGAVIYGWRGDGEAALKAAELGHPFILTPARTLYLIRYQGPQWFEPLTYFGNNTLKDVYQYEPVKDKWKPGYSQLLQGIQGSLWTEFCSTPQDVEYLIYPRLAALAEVAWSEKGKKDWTGFLSRLDCFNRHLSHKGIDYARSMYNIDHKVLPRNGELEVSLSCIRPDLEIRYTTNGDAPDGRSALYSEPLTIAGNCNLKAATFNGSEQKGEVLTLPVHFNIATAKPATGENINTRLLTNGLRGSDRHTDGEWCGWYAQDGSFVADLGERQKITRVSLGSLNNFGMGVHPPRYVKLYLSDNGQSYHQVATIQRTQAQNFAEGTQAVDILLDVHPQKGRFLKVEFGNPGKCPANHVRAQQDTWVYFDELIVE